MDNNTAFSSWMETKSRIRDANIINSYHEGEVWWAAIGQNIGIEINGKK